MPVTLPLKGAGIVGIIGDRPDVVSFTKALLLELTAMHNYEDLKIIFLYDEKERSTWKFVKTIRSIPWPRPSAWMPTDTMCIWISTISSTAPMEQSQA